MTASTSDSGSRPELRSSRATLTREDRLRRSDDFKAIYDGQCRAGDDHLLIFGARNSLGRTRVGLSVSKKHGNAVCRNRLKRLLREAFRHTRQGLPTGLDLILIPRQNSGATLDDYRASLRQTVRRLVKRLPEA